MSNCYVIELVPRGKERGNAHDVIGGKRGANRQAKSFAKTLERKYWGKVRVLKRKVEFEVVSEYEVKQ